MKAAFVAAMAAALAGALALGPAPEARAGVYSDDLARCLARSATPQDQAHLVRWLFAEMARNPALKGLAAIGRPERKALEQAASLAVQRLVLGDCRKEAVAAVKNDGRKALPTSVQALGQGALRDLAAEPAVAQAIAGLGAGGDRAGWDALEREAGVQAAPRQGSAKAGAIARSPAIP